MSDEYDGSDYQGFEDEDYSLENKNAEVCEAITSERPKFQKKVRLSQFPKC